LLTRKTAFTPQWRAATGLRRNCRLVCTANGLLPPEGRCGQIHEQELQMKLRNVVLLSVFLLWGSAVFAQDDLQRVEVFAEYSYFRFNPTIPDFSNRSFNGGGGGVQFNLTRMFAFKAEFMGYGSTTWSATVPSPVVTNVGVIPAGTYSTQANMFTYMFGPVVRIPTSRIVPWGELLFGGSNSNGYGNLTRDIDSGGGTFVNGGTQHPFTMALGGGLDININHNFALRPIELDYVLTRYTNPFTNTNNQNNFRYAGGIVFKF
jgi:hypothetical protein